MVKAWKVGDCGFEPHPDRDREVASSASDRQGTNFECCVWRAVSSHSSHHSQKVLLAQFSLYVHKGGLKPHSYHLTCLTPQIWAELIFYIMRCYHAGLVKIHVTVTAPANMNRRPNVDLLLTHRLRHRPNCKPTPHVCWVTTTF